MVRIVVLGGTGDVYLVSALFEAFQHQHNRSAEIIIREKYACVAEMFPAVRYAIDDAIITRAETDVVMQRDYDNVIADGGRAFFAHPCFLRTNMRVDHLTTKPDVSQADMYKIILRIPPNVPLALPSRTPQAATVRGKVVVIPDARSWPNLHPGFWTLLASRLSYAGWNVQNNNGSNWSLRQLFEHCASAEWVVGPQCGVMSILVTGRFPCRKTLATPDIDGNAHFIFSEHTFPYASVTKFSNQDYDVEEFKITSNTYEDLAEAIINGANGRRLWQHDPAPVCTVPLPLSPGDFLDRYAVLTVKRQRFAPDRRAAIEREFQRHAEASLAIIDKPGVRDLFAALVDVHLRAFDILERAVPQVLADGDMDIADHVGAIRANKERVELKCEVDKVLRGVYCAGDVKSYYDGAAAAQTHEARNRE